MIGCFAPRDKNGWFQRTYMSTYPDTTRHRPTRSQRRLVVHYPDAETLLVLHMKLQRIRGIMYKDGWDLLHCQISPSQKVSDL